MLVFEWVQHPTQAQDRNDIWKLILKLLICCFKLLKRAGPTTPLAGPCMVRTPGNAAGFWGHSNCSNNNDVPNYTVSLGRKVSGAI